MRTFAVVLALAALISSAFADTCEIPIYVQACTTDLNGCSSPVRQEFDGDSRGLPCATTVSDAQHKVENVLRKTIANPVKKPSQVTLGACNLNSPDNHFSKAAQRSSYCSPIQKVNHQILQHAAGLSTTTPDDAGIVEVLAGAVRFVLDGLIETSALQVASLASIRSSVKALTRMERPLVFQYVPSPDWLKRSHEPSRFSVPLMNDTVHEGGVDGWAPAHTADFVRGIHDAPGSDVELRLASFGHWTDLGRGVSHALPYKGFMLNLAATNPAESKRSLSLHGGVAAMTQHAKLHVGAFVDQETTPSVALSHTLRVQVPPLRDLPSRKGHFAVAETVFCEAQPPHNLCQLDKSMVRSGLDMQRVAADDAEPGNRDELIGMSFRFDTCVALASLPTIVPWALVSPGKVVTLSTAFHSDSTMDVHVNGNNVLTFVPVTSTWQDSPVMRKAHNGHRTCWMSQYQRHVFLAKDPADEQCSLAAAQQHVQSWKNYTHFGFYNYMKMPHGFQLRVSGPELALRRYDPADRVEMIKSTISSVATWYGRIPTPRASELVIRAPEGHGFGAETLGRVAAVSVHYADHASDKFKDIMTGWQDVNGQDMPNSKEFFPRAGGGVVLDAQGGYILTSRKAVLGSVDGPVGPEPPACRQFMIKCSSLRNSIASDKPEACFVARVVKLSSPELDLALLKVERGMGQGTAMSKGTINPAHITPATYGSRGVKLLTKGMRKCLKPLHKGDKGGSALPVTAMGWSHHEHDSTGWAAAQTSVDAAQMTTQSLAPATASAPFPHVLPTSPVFYELKDAGDKQHKCTGNRDTDADRESPVLAGVTLHDADAEAGRAASTARFIPAPLLQAFLEACQRAGSPHELLDSRSGEYDIPTCVTLGVNERSGMLSARSTHGIPSYLD